VAFLAIPGVDQTNQAPKFSSVGNSSSTFQNPSDLYFNSMSSQRSWTQIMSYISATASIGTIIVSFVFLPG
jgi:hypothetical protein